MTSRARCLALLQSVAYQEHLPQGSPSRPLSSPSEAQVAQVAWVSGLARLGMLGQEDWYYLRVEHSVQKHVRVWKRWPSIGTSCMALQLLGAILILRAGLSTLSTQHYHGHSQHFLWISPLILWSVHPVCVRLWVGDVCTLYVCICSVTWMVVDTCADNTSKSGLGASPRRCVGGGARL